MMKKRNTSGPVRPIAWRKSWHRPRQVISPRLVQPKNATNWAVKEHQHHVKTQGGKSPRPCRRSHSRSFFHRADNLAVGKAGEPGRTRRSRPRSSEKERSGRCQESFTGGRRVAQHTGLRWRTSIAIRPRIADDAEAKRQPGRAFPAWSGPSSGCRRRPRDRRSSCHNRPSLGSTIKMVTSEPTAVIRKVLMIMIVPVGGGIDFVGRVDQAGCFLG